MIASAPAIHNIGNDIIKSNVEAYRKLRNTFRYLLGNLEGFTDAERVTIGDMPELERVILHRLAELDDLAQRQARGVASRDVLQLHGEVGAE